MTYEDLWLYVNNQYTNAMQAGMLGTDVVISKEDYFLFWKFVTDGIYDVRQLFLALILSHILRKMENQTQNLIAHCLKVFKVLAMNI